MDTWAWIVIGVAALVVILGLLWWAMARTRRRALHERFGGEYEHAIGSADSRRAGERDLRAREAEHDELELRPLSDAARDRYNAEWQELQAGFVDRPMVAVTEADAMVTAVMRDRGYPVDDFEAQSRLVSVDHPDLVDHYRSGHSVAMKAQRNEASTEDLRRAVIDYRAMFEELVHDGSDAG